MHTRLLLWGLGLLLAALGIFFVVTTQTVRSELVREAEQRAERELTTVKWLIAHHGDFESGQGFDDWITEVGLRLGTRISFVAGGKVLADSMVAYDGLSGLDDHSSRPEIAGATTTTVSTSARFSDTLGRDMIYAALRLPPSSGLPRGVVRIAVPISDLTDRVGALRQQFLLLLLGVLTVSALLVYVAAKTLSGSVSAFAEVAGDIGSGDYGRRIREVPGKEFSPLAEAVNTMADRIQTHIATIEDQKGQLGAMFEGLSEGVLVLDAGGRIESFNRAMAAMHPDVVSYIGKTPLEATMNISIQDAVEHILARQDSRAAQFEPVQLEPVQLEVELSGGKHLAISIVPFRDRKDVRKVVLVFHDVTETRRGERMLRDFVANASHQLRTPLTSIKGYAETLIASPPDDPEQAKAFLSTIERNAGHMSEVVSSLLALAKSEQLKRTDTRPVDACAVLRQAAASLAPRAAESKMRIEAEIPATPVFVRADAESLLHVFHNLIENAAKYGPEDTTITVQAIPGEGHVAFHVCDQGGGIAEEHRERIFERFYRVDENAVTGDGSAGLGLAICRQIVENFGGEIACLAPDESPSSQTCFRFTLRRTGSDTPAETTTEKPR